MKKSVLALGLVFGCSGMVPLYLHAQAQPDAKFQFERFGYFVADRKDHQAGGQPVFNRITGLKDSWGK